MQVAGEYQPDRRPATTDEATAIASSINSGQEEEEAGAGIWVPIGVSFRFPRRLSFSSRGSKYSTWLGRRWCRHGYAFATLVATSVFYCSFFIGNGSFLYSGLAMLCYTKVNP